MTSDTACFICNPQPGADRPRTACAQHRDQALLGNGQPLAGIVEQPPPRSGTYNFILNPVNIKDRRAWCDLQSDPCLVLEECFACGSYFDFLAQHDPEAVALLEQLNQVRDQVRQADGWLAVVSALPGPKAGEMMDALFFLWRVQVAVDQLRAEQGSEGNLTEEAVQSLARAAMDRAREVDDPHEFPAMISRLLELSASRFAGRAC